MDDKEAKRSAFSLLNGNYKVTGNWYSSIVVNGSKGVMKKAGNPVDFDIKLGEFGEADPEITKTTNQKLYVKISKLTHYSCILHFTMFQDVIKIGFRNSRSIS